MHRNLDVEVTRRPVPERAGAHGERHGRRRYRLTAEASIGGAAQDERRPRWVGEPTSGRPRRGEVVVRYKSLRLQPNTLQSVRYSCLMAEPNNIGGVSRRGRPSRASVYERLRVQIGELGERLGGLPSPMEAEGIWRGIWLEEAHHSTAIEGNTLVLKQVELLLAEGRAVGNKELSEYLEVRGYANAADWVYGHAIQPGPWSDGELISLAEVRHVHMLAMTPVWDVARHPQATEREGPGSFREHDIDVFPGGMQPAAWTEVPAHMRDWVTHAAALRTTDKAAITEALAALHARFEQIHPFLDGNGRAGRLVLNLLLVRVGIPPAIIYKGDRARYLAALRRADQGDPGPLGEFLARAVLDNLYKFVVPAIAGPARMVPLPALATDELSANALRVAAIRGRLKAAKAADGTWRSSRAWVDEYRATRYRRS
ncbi:MAG: Fic family protein [Solirubrobacteraceae bacterium]